MRVKNPRIFLGNSPWYKHGFYGVRAGSRWPHFERDCDPYMPFPFYLAYTTALLEKDGYNCLLVDGIAERISEEQFLQKLYDYSPDIVLLEVSSPSIDIDIWYGKKVKEKFPDSILIFAGPHVEMYDGKFLEEHNFVDFATIGEYDYTIQELVNALVRGEDYTQIPGVVYRTEEGIGISNGRRESIKNLDQLPWPARHHLPMHGYYDTPGGIPAPSLQMWASRGCPFQCVFCAWPQIMYGDHKYRVRNPKDVVAEIAHCKEKYGMKSFYFDDDTFNIGKPRLLALCEEIQKAKLEMPWAAMSRADTSDRETLLSLKKSGLWSLKFGVESASQEIVDASKKNLKVDKVVESVRYCQELGIDVHLTFTFGLPGETWESIRKTIDFAIELSPNSLQFSIVTPFPGSELYNNMEAEGKIKSKDWSQYNGTSVAVIETDNLSAKDLEKAYHLAYRKWNQHKIFRAIKRPSKWIRALEHPKWTLKELKRAFGSAI